jgi:hypothetical protein
MHIKSIFSDSENVTMALAPSAQRGLEDLVLHTLKTFMKKVEAEKAKNTATQS